MKPLLTYTSFNSTKSIEALQYSILQDIFSLENIKFHLKFYNILLSKSIYRPQVINLYETLVNYKSEIESLNDDCNVLLSALNLQANQISNKIECDDVACDNFFIQEQDDIELKVFNFKTEMANFKFQLLQYIESVIIN